MVVRFFMSSMVAIVAFVLAVFGGYGILGQPVDAPSWIQPVPGLAFSAYQAGQSPLDKMAPTQAQLDHDLTLIADKTRRIRIYTVDGVFSQLPALAASHGLRVTQGAWLDRDLSSNDRELRQLSALLSLGPTNMDQLIIGNETILRKALTPAQLIQYLDGVRRTTKIPLSTAEPWHVWLKHPELAQHVDFIAVHILPFWEGIGVEQSVDFSFNVYRQLQQAFPDKPIVIAEVGWPSQGRTIGAAVASPLNQAIFLRRFLARASEANIPFFIMEAFDQPWKARIEGSVGAYWGVFDAARAPKFAMDDKPIAGLQHGYLLASLTCGLALLLAYLLLRDAARLRFTGRLFLIFNAFAVSAWLVYMVQDFLQHYHSNFDAFMDSVLLLGVVGIFTLVLVEAHEWTEAMWPAKRLRSVEPLAQSLAQPSALGGSESDEPAFVSIHVPAFEEPPAMLIQTLEALAALDYPRFEVIVVDNNTSQEALWRPVQACCERLGTRFHFHHVSPLEGYKAGALNFALSVTHPQAGIIAVVDADYVVSSDWLKALVPLFENPSMAVVQAPQDYRDGGSSVFKSLCHAEYKGFFQVGMVTRNERNAIIQHGTMTMVRKPVLESIGAWSEGTITEDAELGLRVLEHGYETQYVNHSFGRGLIPDNFTDFKNQRYRWVYGAMQILREHAGHLLGGRRSGLTVAQRYHFVSGWLPWMADGMHMVFTLLAIAWSLLMLNNPLQHNAPSLLVSAAPVLFVLFRITKMLALYLGPVQSTVKTALAAMLAGLSLSHTVGRAALGGLFSGQAIAFVRTPKMTNRVAWLRALRAAREETLLALALTILSVSIALMLGLRPIENMAWCLLLLCQSLPYAAASIMSLTTLSNPQKAPRS